MLLNRPYSCRKMRWFVLDVFEESVERPLGMLIWPSWEAITSLYSRHVLKGLEAVTSIYLRASKGLLRAAILDVPPIRVLLSNEVVTESTLHSKANYYDGLADGFHAFWSKKLSVIHLDSWKWGLEERRVVYLSLQCMPKMWAGLFCLCFWGFSTRSVGLFALGPWWHCTSWLEYIVEVSYLLHCSWKTNVRFLGRRRRREEDEKEEEEREEGKELEKSPRPQ